ncbi:hypothetical protein [Mycobacterium servetii]|uniref:hypothetical protein n=1 Tax=Mycobacterium servetii TaxID=3237418 RepID=UPI00350F0A08
MTHHLIRTFLGWAEKQLPEGTLILTAPSGHTDFTTPGSALLFPSLAPAVGGCPPEIDPDSQDYYGARTAMMPKRRRTRAQLVAAERRNNHQARTAAHAGRTTWQQRYFSHEPTDDDEPPPF